MVRYLGLDYLRLAVNQKQDFLNRALIAVPEHLEVIDLYAHRGCFQDDRYRFPWKRAVCDKEFIQDEIKNGSSLALPVPDVQQEVKVEKYDSFCEEYELGFFDLDDFVASSDPEEIFGPFDDEENQTKINQKPGSFEVFQKESLDLIETVEEPISPVPFTSNGSILPSLKCLSQRLHQNQIKDPFLIEDLYNLKSLCTISDPCVEEKSLIPVNDCFQEEYHKFKILEDEMVIEEPLSPFSSKKEVFSLKPTEEENVLPIDIDVQDLDDLQPPSKTEEKSEAFYVETSENINKEYFLSINDAGEKDGLLLEKERLLDSPIITDNLHLEPETLDLTSLIDSLPKFELVASSTERIVTEEEKQKIEMKMWKKEKFFNDILSMRLPEPEIKQSEDTSICLQEILHQQSLTTEETTEDLELNWDPVGNNVIPIKTSMSSVEAIEYSCEEGPVKDLFGPDVEKFGAELHDWQDEKIDFPSKHTSSEIMDPEKESGTVPDNEKIEITPVIVEEKTEGQRTKTFDEDDFGFNHIDDFFTLRTGKQLIKKPAQKDNKKDEINLPTINQSNQLNDHKGTKLSSEIVTVHLGGKYQEIHTMMTEKMSYFISALKASGSDTTNLDLSTLATDYTRFLLKQKEKQIDDTEEKDKEADESYKAIVCLHALTGAREILHQYCLESAIAHLQNAEEKYKSNLTGGLEDIRQELFKLSCSFQQKNICHPKVMATCKEVERCLNSQSTAEKRVVIVLKKAIPSFVNVLEKALGHCPSINLHVQTEKSDLSINKTNCLIISDNHIHKDFPWTMFSLVIEYDYAELSNYCKLCEDLNIKYIGFIMKTKPQHSCSQEVCAPTMIKMSKDQEQRIIIGSSKLIEQQDILQLLETRYNMVVIERNYSMFEKTLCFPDVDIDEKACIVIHKMSDLSDEANLEPFIKRIISLSLKYTKCWILLCNLAKSGKSYPYAGKYVSNLFKLQASLSNYIGGQDSFDAKVIACRSTEETCAEIREICDIEREISSVWTHDEWKEGAWIKEKPSKEENFLLGVPCLNTISCQIILQKMTIIELMTLSLDDFVTTLTLIPKRIRKMLYKVIHIDQGLNTKLSSIKKTDDQVIKEQSQIKASETGEITQLKSSSKYFDQGETTIQPPILHHRKISALDKKNHDDVDGTEINEFETNVSDKDVFKSNFDARHNIRPDVDSTIDIDDDDVICTYSNIHNNQHPKSQMIEFYNNGMDVTNEANDQIGTVIEKEYDGDVYIDTQNTDDVLSLNGSQSSVKLNEFERAELEGSIHALPHLEDPSDGFTSRHFKILSGINSPEAATAAHRSRDVQYARVTPSSHTNVEHIFGVPNNQGDKWKRSTPFKRNDDHSFDIPNVSPILPDQDTSYTKSMDRIHVRNPSTEKNTVGHVGHQVRPLGDNYPREMNNKTLSRRDYPEQFTSESRNFSRNLSETTRNILKQVTVSPRFGVRPTRRISIGLAQPLRRETTKGKGDNGFNSRTADRSSASQSSGDQTYRSDPRIDTTQGYSNGNGRESSSSGQQNSIYMEIQHLGYQNENTRDFKMDSKNNLLSHPSRNVNHSKPFVSNDSLEQHDRNNDRISSHNEIKARLRREEDLRDSINDSRKGEDLYSMRNQAKHLPQNSMQNQLFASQRIDFYDSFVNDRSFNNNSNINSGYSDNRSNLAYQQKKELNRSDLNRETPIKQRKWYPNRETPIEQREWEQVPDLTRKIPMKQRQYEQRAELNKTEKQRHWEHTLANSETLLKQRQYEHQAELNREIPIKQRQWEEYDSPPMDLDYLDNKDTCTYKMSGQEVLNNSMKDTSMTNRLYITNDKGSKKRRLGYKRLPGSKGGQTKLVFK